jgi:uncharacterized protein with von Willebrand factor type A (vWA) domain
LILYLDKSGSMRGPYIKVLKEACIDMGEKILFV